VGRAPAQIRGLLYGPRPELRRPTVTDANLVLGRSTLSIFCGQMPSMLPAYFVMSHLGEQWAGSCPGCPGCPPGDQRPYGARLKGDFR
jgi:hypothetical protein